MSLLQVRVLIEFALIIAIGAGVRLPCQLLLLKLLLLLLLWVVVVLSWRSQDQATVLLEKPQGGVGTAGPAMVYGLRHRGQGG